VLPATALLLVVVAITAACRSTTTSADQSTGRTTAATSTNASSPASSGAPTAPASGASGPSRASSSVAAPGVPLLAQGYVALFPFAGLRDAQQWERAYRTGGHQPWHLDAGATAVAFARGYLGFTGVDRVTSRRTGTDGAHVGVGYRNPAGRLATAAVLHLMRFGVDAEAPWEVVGSDDTTFTLELPRYASHVTTPVTMGGLITGVDENVSVAVRRLGTETPLGRAGPVAAGGQARPWSVRVSYSGARAGALTLVAVTGGHVRQVERFAITGVYTR
jgi:hypothetical protein